MKIVSRENIDAKEWEGWCNQSTDSQPFLHLFYLDAVAENTLFLLNDQGTGGIPLPYFQRMGVKTLYMPVFCRWIDWVGNDCPSKEELTKNIKSIFQQGEIYFRKDILNLSKEELIYQKLSKEQFKLNAQAKRKIKNIEKENYLISQEIDSKNGSSLIRTELSNKFETLHENNFDSLEMLLSNLHKKNILHSFNLRIENNLVGVLFLVQTKDNLLYLKGACKSDVKKKGGMYALMQAAIDLALESNLNFDFGGSRIAGVRQFNQCFGGEDQTYYQYKWSDGPVWYNLLKTIRNKWKRK